MPLTRLVVASSLVLALTACAGANLGSVLGGLPIGGLAQCNTGTSVQLASPQAFQSGVPGNIGQVVIVANGQNNTLGSTYGQWYLTLTPQYGGNPIQGGNLNPADGRSLAHPYGSDYYYSSSIPQLPSGVTWNVQLNESNSNCQGVPLSSFST